MADAHPNPSTFAGNGAPLTAEGLSSAAGLLGCDVAAVGAVIEVETKGCGFLADRRPKILFERHIFHRETAGRFDATAPDLSHPKGGGYGSGGAAQYPRLERAMALDRDAALRGASWGLGQIMGFNAGLAGFADAPAMIAAFADSEDAQLAGLARFCTGSKLDKALREHRWADFARGYNGPNFKENAYDAKLDAAWTRLSRDGPADLRFRAAQVYLMYLGFDPGPIDGQPGKRTARAMAAFADRSGLPVSHALDDATFGHLHRAAMDQP